MTACFSADVTLRAAQEALSRHEQWLPIDGDSDATMGRLVEINSTGPLRLGFGAWRDLLLGAQFLNGNDELISAGGRTVKNVAGYDLTKFMVGQGGVFGRLVTLTTRTYKRPVGAILASFAPDAGILRTILSTALRPQWALLTREAMLCGYVGDERSLALWEARLPERSPTKIDRRTLDEDIAHRTSLWTVRAARVARISIPPARLHELAASMGDANWVADASFGIVMMSLDQNPSAIESAVRSLGGNMTIITDDAMIAPAQNANERELLARLKLAFDPAGRLKPLIS